MMQNHSWINEVLDDLVNYADDNDLPEELLKALTVAAQKAKRSLPVVYTDFIPLSLGTPNHR